MFSFQHTTVRLLLLLLALLFSGCSDESTPAEPVRDTTDTKDTSQAQEPVTPVETPSTNIAKVTTAAPAKGPRLGFGPSGERHGAQQPEWTTEHTFELSSAGTEALIISRVDGAGGCEVVEVLVEDAAGEMAAYGFGDPIAAGRDLHVRTTIHAEESTCNVSPRVQVVSNDPRGSFRIDVAGGIDPYLSIAPRILGFGSVKHGGTMTGEALIITNDTVPVELKIVEQESPVGLSFALAPVDAGDDGKATTWKLLVTLGPGVAEGALAHRVTVQSDVEIPVLPNQWSESAAFYLTQLDVNAQVIGDFSSSPQYLSMGLIRSNQAVTRTVKVECHDPDFSLAQQVPTVRITGLQIPGTSEFKEWEYAGCFTTAVEPVAGENAVEIEVRLEGLPKSARGSLRGALVIDLEHPRKKQIVKVITGVCR